MTSVSCSLADDLQVDDGEVEDDTSASPSSPLRPDARLPGDVVISDNTLPFDDTAPAVEDEETVLHSNAPLTQYLGLHHIDPLHTVSVVAASQHDGAAEEEEDDEDVDLNSSQGPAHHHQHATASSPYERHPPLSSSPLLSLLTVFCPTLLPWTFRRPSNGNEQWAVHLCREQWHYTAQRCTPGLTLHSIPSIISISDAGQHSPAGLFPLLRVALLVQSLLLTYLILISVSLLLSSSAVSVSFLDLLIPAVVLPVLMLITSVNWMASYRQLRWSFAWHSSAGLLLSYHSSYRSCNRLIQRAIQRVTEVELVSKGYFLSPSPTPILIMDLKQAAHLRHSTQLRRTLHSTLHHLHSVMEEALKMDGCRPAVSCTRLALRDALRVLWSCADVSSVFTLPIDSLSPMSREEERQVKEVIPSLVELKWMKDELDTMQSTLWSHLTSHSTSSPLDPFTLCRLLLPLQSVVQGVERRLKAALRFDPAATPPRTASADGAPLSAPSPLSLVDDKLRSARARLYLVSRRSPSSTTPLLSDLHYIQQVINDVSATCRQMEQQINQSAAPPTEDKEQPSHALVNSAAEEEKEGTDESDSDKSALMQEMQGLRRRRGEQPEGQGLLFEGEGQHLPHRAENDDSLPPKRFKPQPSSSPSPFALTLSMVTELKSVLSHRAPVPFHALSD